MVKISIFIFEGSRSFRERAGGKSQNKTRGRNLTCVDSQAKIPRVPKKGKLNKLELYTNREKRKEQKEGGTKKFLTELAKISRLSEIGREFSSYIFTRGKLIGVRSTEFSKASRWLACEMRAQT